MRELLTEVLASTKGKKMRIALTGFSIGWGIFILIVLISAGNGLINGMKYNFKAYNIGMVTLTPRTTSLPFEGQREGRPVRLYEDDAAYLKRQFGDTVVRTIPVVSHPVQARRGKGYANTSVDGYAPGYAAAPNVHVTEGRDLNDNDMQQQRKVCVIPARLKEVFFPQRTASVVGQTLRLNDIPFVVIGVYEPWLTENTSRAIFAPLSTVKTLFSPEGRLDRLYLQTAKLTTEADNVKFNARVRRELAVRKGFAPTDMRAVKIDNLYELPVLVNSILTSLNIFVVVIGLATLISGIVGISNIMLITVKERTREIGIRRAVGSKGRQIIMLVLSESVVIALTFGYAGMALAVILMELVDKAIEQAGSSNVFSHPTISLSYVLIISIVMVVAGLIAGYIPAKYAARIKLVDALSASNNC